MSTDNIQELYKVLKNKIQCIPNPCRGYKKKLEENFIVSWMAFSSAKYNAASNRIYYFALHLFVNYLNSKLDNPLIRQNTNIKCGHEEVLQYITHHAKEYIDIYQGLLDNRVTADYYGISVSENKFTSIYFEFLKNLNEILDELKNGLERKRKK